MDNVPGVGKVNIKYSVYDAMSVSVSYNKKHYDYVVLDPHFANIDKTIGLSSIGGESGSTYAISALTVSMQ